MARLRAPVGGCPWDLEQSFASIAPHTIEEAFEVVDAIDQGDMAHLKDELGDLLFQVVFYAQMADEQNHFDFHDVVAAITAKMIRRHPHVFGPKTGPKTGIDSAADQTAHWETIKASERAAKASAAPETPPGGALADVSRGLPALMRANKLQKRAARVGFDWPDAQPVFDKFREECAELEVEIERAPVTDQATPEIDHEVGDLLFTGVNLARKLGVDPEAALRRANGRFEARFGHIEGTLEGVGKRVEDTDLDELERLWKRAKQATK